ncbi:MAG TPA: AAC(3) family N-acetyltransferase [Candidatus Glassbacteria bacterium]|nr:AAC(3) family N-acetyltransferase [Candidatus Glassbacteria bacterium]
MSDRKKEYPSFTKELVVDGLRDLGLGPGDTLLMHSSLKDLAPARQLIALPRLGMPVVIDALREVVGPEGLIVLPTLTACFANSATGPTGYVWDKKIVPSRVGDITNYFLEQRGVRRSDHPSHSLAALGRDASEFAQGHRWNETSTFGRHSPWGKLLDRDGWILMFGTYLNTCTMVHCVEDWMGLPYLEINTAVILDENRDVKFVTVTGSPTGPRDFYIHPGSKLEGRFYESDVFRTKKICMADVTLMRARAFVRLVWDCLLEEPTLLLSEEDDPWTVKYREATRRQLARFDKPFPW